MSSAVQKTAAHNHSDILIVGGGMAGGLQALLLADAGFSVQVLDGAAAPAWPEGKPAARVSTLSDASRWLLHHTGVWSRLRAERVQPYHAMQVWDQDGTGEVCFRASDAGADGLGWLLENNHLTAALHAAAAERPHLHWLCERPVTELQRTVTGWQVCAGGDRFNADVLIGADGAHSRVRDAAGIAATARPSGHHALVATIECDRPHGGCARQVFMESGPLALLPLFADTPATESHRCSIVWSAWPERIDALMALDDAAFSRALDQATAEALGSSRVAGSRARFPILERHASRYVGPALALIGDAAHVIHPLAGQGINLGLLDAGVLAEELARARVAGLRPSHPAVLARYERRRRGSNLLMQNAMRGFKWLFERPEPTLRWLRNVGLGGVNRMPPLRHAFAEQALGRRGDLPRLARRP